VARGKNLVTGAAEVHAIEPTAQEHGRVVGANMAGRDVAYRGSLLMNIVEVCHLDVASFGQWDDKGADVYVGLRPERSQYRKLLFRGGRLTGAMICGPANDIWTTNDVGILKGLVQTGVDLSAWKSHLARDPFDVKPAFMATRTTAALLPQTILGRPSQSPSLPQSVATR
jgi:NAD(P)H-nitrite reductase large subunit